MTQTNVPVQSNVLNTKTMILVFTTKIMVFGFLTLTNKRFAK